MPRQITDNKPSPVVARDPSEGPLEFNRRGFLGGLLFFGATATRLSGAVDALVGCAPAPAFPSIDVGTIAGHLLHGEWGARRSLAAIQEKIFSLGSVLEAQEDPAGDLDAELAWNLVGCSPEDLRLDSLLGIREGLNNKCHYARHLLERLKALTTANNDATPDHFSAEDLEEIDLIFNSPFKYVNVDQFPDIVVPENTDSKFFDWSIQSKYDGKPLELLKNPDYVGFIIGRVEESIKRLHQRSGEISRILEFVEDHPTSILAKLVQSGDMQAYEQLNALGKQLTETYTSMSGGCGGVIDHCGWVRYSQLSPRHIGLPYGIGKEVESDTVTKAKVAPVNRHRIGACTHAFIFVYGNHRLVDSSQQISIEGRQAIEEIFERNYTSPADTIDGHKLEIFSFLMLTSEGDYLLARHQSIFDSMLMSWIERRYGGTLDLGRFSLMISDGTMTLRDTDLLSSESNTNNPIHSEPDGVPEFKFLALEDLVLRRAVAAQLPDGEYTINRSEIKRELGFRALSRANAVGEPSRM